MRGCLRRGLLKEERPTRLCETTENRFLYPTDLEWSVEIRCCKLGSADIQVIMAISNFNFMARKRTITKKSLSIQLPTLYFVHISLLLRNSTL